MSYTQVFIHYVWSTKLRKPLLIQPYRQQLFDHIKQNALLKDIRLDRINGYIDHVHCLVGLKPDQSIDKIAQLLKGESAYWFNHAPEIKAHKLEWQRNYFALSVSLSALGTVRKYIDNQEAHHSKKTFEDEYNEFVKEYLFVKEPETSLAHFKLNTGR